MGVRFTFIHALAPYVIPQINLIIDVVHHFMMFENYKLLDAHYPFQAHVEERDLSCEEKCGLLFAHMDVLFYFSADDPTQTFHKLHDSETIHKYYVDALKAL